MDDFETRIDSVDREDIWKPYVEEWLENFKSEDTPIERRIIDYRINGYGSSYNNENRIQMEVLFEVTPYDENNTEWENPRRSYGFINMVKEDGEYKLKYLSDVPEGYDKFMESFEEWKKTNSTTETVTLQGENKNLSSAQEQEINIMSTSIVAGCTAVLIVIGALVVFRIIKSFK